MEASDYIIILFIGILLTGLMLLWLDKEDHIKKINNFKNHRGSYEHKSSTENLNEVKKQ